MTRKLCPPLVLLLTLAAAATCVAAVEDPSMPGGDKALVADGHVFHDVGALWNHVTNWGLIGANAGATCTWCDAPSARWPGETGDDYLWAAGLWVGGRVLGETLVSTGQFDREIMATDAAGDTIFSTASGAVGGSRYPWPDPDDDGDGLEDEDPLNGLDDDEDGLVDEDFAAVSDQHFRCTMSDYTPLSTELYPDHTPLMVSVVQNSYQWSAPEAADFIGYDYAVTNDGVAAIEDVYLGMFADFEIPANPLIGGEQNDLAEYYEGVAADANGRQVDVRLAYMHDETEDHPYIGFVLCGHTVDAAGVTAPTEISVSGMQIMKPNVDFIYGGDPTNDAERYELLSTAGIDSGSPSWAPRDYRVLLCCGPFPTLAPGATVEFQTALVIGEDLDALIATAAEAVSTWQGQTFDRDEDPSNGDEYVVRWLREDEVPVPAFYGRIAVRHVSGCVALEIATNVALEEGLVVARLGTAGVPDRTWSGAEISATGGGLSIVDTDAVGWPRIYELRLLVDGVETCLDRVEVTQPVRDAPELSVGPNPFNPRLEIDYVLTRGGPVEVTVTDLRGRVVRRLLDESRPAGAGTLVWDGKDDAGRGLASGVYRVHLASNGYVVEAGATLVR